MNTIQGDNTQNKDSGKNTNKPGFLGWLKRSINIFASHKPQIGSDFKKEKEDITNYEEVFSNEKKKRAGADRKAKPGETVYTVPEEPLISKEKPIITPQAPIKKEEGSIIMPQAPIKKEEKPKISHSEETIKEKLVSVSEKWKAPKILKTNLIKGEITTFIDWKKNIRLLSINIALVLLILGAIYFGLVFWEVKATEQSQTLGGEISGLKSKIIKAEESVQEVDVFQEKLKYASLLLDQHVYWTNVFEFLENNLLSDVVITGAFTGDLSGEFKLAAQADSYNTIAKQIKILRLNKDITEVEVTGGTLNSVEDEDGRNKTVVNFTLGFSINPAIFRNKHE